MSVSDPHMSLAMETGAVRNERLTHLTAIIKYCDGKFTLSTKHVYIKN